MTEAQFLCTLHFENNYYCLELKCELQAIIFFLLLTPLPNKREGKG